MPSMSVPKSQCRGVSRCPAHVLLHGREVRDAVHEPEARGLLRAELAPGERELTDEGVRAHKLWEPRLSISKIFDSRGSVIDLNFK